MLYHREYDAIPCGCRESLESTLATWRDGDQQLVSADDAQRAWQQYEALTAPLAQDLCEQLRLVLEPSQASKLKYATCWQPCSLFVP